MEQYAAEQLALFATNNPLYYYEGENKIHIKIESRKILDDANNKRNASSSSNNNSILRQLIESSLLHIIVRVYSPAEYVQIRLKYLANVPSAISSSLSRAINKRIKSATTPRTSS
eukprot:scaffold5639_cov100-Isochrysis_galbana.AAC.1